MNVTIRTHDGPGDGSEGSPEAPFEVTVHFDGREPKTVWCHKPEHVIDTVAAALNLFCKQ